MSNFRKTLLCTAIPIVVTALIGIAVFPAWLAAVSLAGVALVAGIILLMVEEMGYIMDHSGKYRQVATGMLAGSGIGILALGATCFPAVTQLG